MAIPDGFNDFEHLQSTITRVHNRRVREVFSDIGEDFDLAVPRSSLKFACLIKDNDTCDMMNMRFNLFYLSCNELVESLEPYYGIPVAEHKANVNTGNIIVLKFSEDDDDIEDGYQPLRMKASYRVINNNSITKTELKTLASKINLEFPNSYRFHKGKELYTYLDIENGFDFQLYAYSKQDARDLILKVQDIADRPGFDEEKFKAHLTESTSAAYPTNPGTAIVLGQTVKKPRKRPVGYCRFRQAFADIKLYPRPICLVDRTGRKRDLLDD